VGLKISFSDKDKVLVGKTKTSQQEKVSGAVIIRVTWPRAKSTLVCNKINIKARRGLFRGGVFEKVQQPKVLIVTLNVAGGVVRRRVGARRLQSRVCMRGWVVDLRRKNANRVNK